MKCVLCGRRIRRKNHRTFCSPNCWTASTYIKTSPLMVKRFNFIVERQDEGAMFNPDALHHFLDNGLIELREDRRLYVTKKGLHYKQYLDTLKVK